MTYIRPRTTAELNKLAVIEFNPQINIKHYIRSAELLIKQARVYRSEGDLENAYVLYLKYTSLGIAELPKHPAYKDPENKKQIKSIKLNCLEALDALETLKPRLDAAYQEHTEYILHRLESDKTEEPTGQEQQNENQNVMADEKSGYKEEQLPPMPTNSSGKTQVEEDNDDRGKWSMQKALEGVVRVGEKNVYVEGYREAGWGRWEAACVFYRVKGGETLIHLRSPDVLMQRPVAQYPQHASRNQSDRLSYQERPPPPARPPPLPPKPVIDHNNNNNNNNNSAPQQDYRPPLPERDNRYHYNPPTAPALPPKIRLDEEERHHHFQREEAQSLTTTEEGMPLRTLSVPVGIHQKFLGIARLNTEKNIETCGILCGKLRNNMLRITTLIIPKQSGTPDTCTTENEEQVFEYQDSQDLLTLGWIHTHPSQSCFLSSLDLHTHCSYQLMLPEAIAIVCAPKHDPNFGVFRLTDPPGLGLITECRAQGAFHPHPDMPIYTDTHNDTGHVRMTMDDFKTVDLRI